MLQDLKIIHRRKPLSFEPADLPVWATCLRSLAFVPSTHNHGTAGILATDEVHSAEAAYRFLLEVTCGLHSPIVGETEVFGQFKIFAQEWLRLEPRWGSLIQHILNDTKALRSRYLNGLGSQSYGGFLRKNLRSSRVHVLGAGHLAQEILPYLAKQSQTVVHARRPQAVPRLEGVEVVGLRAGGFDQGALVVAAPLSAPMIRLWLNGAKPSQIFDLRETSSHDVLAEHAVTLAQIFKKIEITRAQFKPKIEMLKSEIEQRARLQATQEKVRPQGWDDLCA